MARNHKFYFDSNGSPKARGPASEKILMTFLEVDVQGSDHICRDLMDDLTAIEDESDDTREFVGNAYSVTMTPSGVNIISNLPDDSADELAATPNTIADPPATKTGSPAADISKPYQVELKHFREVLEDWEAFILDDQLDDPLSDDKYS